MLYNKILKKSEKEKMIGMVITSLIVTGCNPL